MNRRRRISFFSLVLLAASVGVSAWLTWRTVRQVRLDRALISTIKTDDTPAALAALNAGANPNTRDNAEPPRSFLQILRQLFRRHHRAELYSDKRKPTALILAVHEENVAVVRVLLDRGASVAPVDEEGTPILTSLADHLPGIVVDEKYVRKPASHQVALREIARLLIDKGISVNVQDGEGETALMQAAYYGHAELIRLLLERGATVQARDIHGVSAVVYGVAMGETECVRLLLDHGADVNAEARNGYSLLLIAIKLQSVQMARLLLSRGAKCRMSGEDIPAMQAAKHYENNPEMLALLKKAGAKE